VGCSTVQRRGQGRPSKEKVKEEPKQKRKVSGIDSEASEGEKPLSKKAKSRSIIEDSQEEWEEWNGIQETEEVWEGVDVVREEVTEEIREMDKREAKRARREARRWERKARRSEWSEKMDELIDAVMELGDRVEKFAGEVRVSNALRNRADQEYLEERRN
jgi:hypothetical protein